MSHKSLRRRSCHVLSETNMASSNHSNNDPASIQSIASTAISHIQQLVSLVEQRPTAASTSSNELQVATPRAGTALEELRRRFPTVSARRGVTALTRAVSGEKQIYSGNLEILPGIGKPGKFFGKYEIFSGHWTKIWYYMLSNNMYTVTCTLCRYAVFYVFWHLKTA